MHLLESIVHWIEWRFDNTLFVVGDIFVYHEFSIESKKNVQLMGFKCIEWT